MGWRRILEAEHRLMLEVADAAGKECEHIEASGAVRADLVGDILGFFRFFCDGLHDPKENGLLFAHCHKQGMPNDDEPLEQMLGEHEWCAGRLDKLQVELKELPEGDGGATLAGLVGAGDDELARHDLARDLWRLDGEADHVALGQRLPVGEGLHDRSP